MTQAIISYMEIVGYKIFTRPYELNIVGIRNSDLTPNVFNDTINVLYRDNNGEWQHHTFPATTDPGTYWLQNPSNPQGTAILKHGQYLHSHIIGMHRSKYLALIQRGLLTVIRDAKRDGSLDLTGKEDIGYFGINIHRASEQGVTKFIDKHSAGCQVFANADDFTKFMQMCDRQRQLYGNSFSYTLIEQSLLAIEQAAY